MGVKEGKSSKTLPFSHFYGGEDVVYKIASFVQIFLYCCFCIVNSKVEY